MSTVRVCVLDYLPVAKEHTVAPPRMAQLRELFTIPNYEGLTLQLAKIARRGGKLLITPDDIWLTDGTLSIQLVDETPCGVEDFFETVCAHPNQLSAAGDD